VVRALATSEEMYADSALALHLPKELPERPVDHLGFWALETGNAGLAIHVFRRNVALHPESARAHASLAEAYLEKRDTAAAVDELQRAVRIWRETGAELSAASRRKLQLLARSAHRKPGLESHPGNEESKSVVFRRSGVITANGGLTTTPGGFG